MQADDPRPSGQRRSWWLREAFAAEAATTPELLAASTAPPLRGTTTADVVIVGGGYTGLWTAFRLTELEPGARVVLLEADVCGGGPSGRNGGFVTNWWDELPTLIERYGEAGAMATAEAMEAAVDELGAWCAAHGVDAWYTKAGSLGASAAPAQDDAWDEAIETCRRLGLGDRYTALTAEEVAARVRSPVFRGGVFMPGAATDPARVPRPRPATRAPRAGRRHPRGYGRRRDRWPAAGLARGGRRWTAAGAGGPTGRRVPAGPGAHAFGSGGW